LKPTPRRVKIGVLLEGAKDRPGTTEARSESETIWRSFSSLPETAVIDRPTLLMFSSRLLAVTMMSWIPGCRRGRHVAPWRSASSAETARADSPANSLMWGT
jgi:hypothetical protein